MHIHVSLYEHRTKLGQLIDGLKTWQSQETGMHDVVTTVQLVMQFPASPLPRPFHKRKNHNIKKCDASLVLCEWAT
jgi:hypothetical protein